MGNFLTAVPAGVDHGAETARAAHLLGKDGHEIDHFTEKGGVFGAGFGQGNDMLLGMIRK